MPKQQRIEVAPPLAEDKEFQDFASVVQNNFVDLFQVAHDHPLHTSAPTTSEGNIGDIQLVNLSGTYYIYAKVAIATWKRVVLS